MAAKRAGILCRISQRNERIPKVEVQEALCRELAAREGYEVVAECVYVDDGISAFAFARRPGWEQMLKDVDKGKFDVLLAQSESRFTRQPMEKEILMLACNQHGVTFHTVNEGMTDIGLPDGQFMSGLRGLTDRLMVSTSQLNSRKSNDAHRAKGLPSRGGVRPFGYAKDKIHLEPVEAKLIEEASEGYGAGKTTLSAIRDTWNEGKHFPDSGKPWTHNKVRQVLLRPTNAGLVQHRGAILRDGGEPVIGKWKTIVDIKTWEKVVHMVEAMASDRGRAVVPRWLCSSVASCGSCGRRMRLAMRNKDEASYRCASHENGPVRASGVRHVSIAAALLDEAVADAASSAVIFAPTLGVSDADEESLAALNIELGVIRRSESNLLELVESETFSAGEVAAKRAELRLKAEELDREIKSILGGSVRASLLTETRLALWSSSRPSFEDAAKAKSEVRERFDALALIQKRALIEDMLEVVVVNGRGPGRIQIRHLVALGLNEDM